MALIGISKHERWDYVSTLDSGRVLYPETIEDPDDPAQPATDQPRSRPHPKAGQVDIAASREAGATIFFLGALTVNQRAYITDKTGVVQEWGDNGARFVHRQGLRNLEAVRLGLRGWENFSDPSGDAIPYETTQRAIGSETPMPVPTDDTIGRLGIYLVNEIGEEILNKNAVAETMQKNLNGRVQQ